MRRHLGAIWADIRAGRNIDVYVTVIAAAAVTVLGIIGIADQLLISAVILATLALVAVGLLVNRRNDEQIKQLLDQTISREARASDFFSTDIAPEEEALKTATEIVLTGITLQQKIRRFPHLLEERLRAGATIEMMLLEPSKSNVEQMVLRGWRDIPNGFCENLIESSVTFLDVMTNSEETKGTLEIGYLPFHPSFTLAMVDPDQPHGLCWVNVLHHKLATPTPVFKISKQDDPAWFEFFHNQFEVMWKSCRIETYPRRPAGNG